ncbi:class I SAM-dependent methyltransferase [Winogradskyella alexanderae]|uniref:Class I SAM-dependent methyltransferase n=1 Tax=Winogradskyella alexanderae TaxID=2877123 RepID=A0ABS7XTV8_9FLAO|nr:class I SAM-dependent methyltransferase [Winogradskyella alexanderae]MCA0132441.1 class I SAM-dependent methyltransferase [Winogradskyella alexanderae]
MSEYKDYNWRNDGFSHAHSYLIPALIDMLPNDGSPILDLGCGNGAIANYLLDQGFDVYGIDASETGIALAKTKHPERFFIHDVSTDALPEPLQEIPFKTIISTEVIEHLYSPRKYIQFCSDILIQSGGGALIISTPYHGFLKNLALSIFNAWDSHFTVLWDGGHIKFWSYKTLGVLLREYDFKSLAFKGCGRLPYLWKSMIIKAEI